MKNLISILLCALTSLTLTTTQAAGFQRAQAANPDGKPLEIGIWYPSQMAPAALAMGPVTMSVALNGPIAGRALPLVVISHGSGSSLLGHHDTAAALADAGYVVAALTHTGDNHADQSRSVFIMDRPRQISRVIDHMLASWDGRGALDPARIGMFGFSAGGFTTLVSIGGRPDMSKVAPTCLAHPTDFACALIARQTSAVSVLPHAEPAHDPRIKAAVVVAPALGFTFSPDGLKNVRIPVQLWHAEDDVILPSSRYAEPVRQALPNTTDYRVAHKAGHFDFLSPCSAALARIAPPICASAPGFDRLAFHQTFNASVRDFFDRRLARLE